MICVHKEMNINFFIVCKLLCKQSNAVYVDSTDNTLKMEHNFQCVFQKIQYSNNLNYLEGHLSQNFIKKSSPQPYRTIMTFKIFCVVRSIKSMETWGEFSCVSL